MLNDSPVESLQRIQEQSGGEIVDGTVGTFCRERVYSEKLSAEAGEPVYMVHDYCDIRVPGNVRGNHRELIRKIFPDGREVIANEFHLKKYGRAWDAFLRGEDLKPVGTLIEDCDAIPRARLAGLKAADIRTVEELAQLPDRSLQRIGPDGRALQRAAAQYLEENSEQAKQAEELALLREKVAELEARETANNADNQNTPAKPGGKRRSSGS